MAEERVRAGLSNFARAAASASPDDGGVEMLRDVVVPQVFYNRITTGHALIDMMYGGEDMPGLLPGSVHLLTGLPGAGKSTFMLQLAQMLTDRARSVQYNLGEESKFMVKRAAERMQLDGSFPISQFEELGRLSRFVRERGVEVLIQDSLQSLSLDGVDSRNQRLMMVTKGLVRLAQQTGAVVILIGHITKGGKFAGPQEIEHDVDVSGQMRLNKDNGNRVFNLHKNRFGPAMVPIEFTLSAKGLNFMESSTDPTDEGKPPTKAASRKEVVLARVRELLLAGEGVSGYTYQEDAVLKSEGISGGFMRSALAIAVSDLRAEGHRVEGRKVNNRETFFVEEERQ